MCAPRVNGTITSNESTRDVSAKRGKNREEEGEGRGCEGCPRKNRKFRRDPREQRGEVVGVKEKGLGRLEAACLQELCVVGGYIEGSTRGRKGHACRGDASRG